MNAIDLSTIAPKVPFGDLLSKTTTGTNNTEEKNERTKRKYPVQVEQEHIIEDAFALIKE